MSVATVEQTQIIQWFKNGDHPLDGVGDWVKDPVYGSDYIRQEGAVVRFFRHPDVEDELPCRSCGHPAKDHGWIDSGEAGDTVCPGDYIVQDETGAYVPLKPGRPVLSGRGELS